MENARAKRGTKRTCVGCGERFYDLDRDPIVCPACGNVHGPDAFVKQRPLAVVAPEAPARSAPKQEKDDDDLDLDDVGLDDDDSLIDDAAEMDDDDDMDDVGVDVDVDVDEEDS